MPPRTRILIVGVDAATFDVIDPLVQAGQLPAFARLMERGARCVLKSTIPATTPCAWTTFATGVGPGKHGVVDFRYLAPGTYHLVRSDAAHVRSRPLWSLLDQAGLSVGLYNVPWSDPAAAGRGYVIGGMDAWAAAQRCNPAELAREITRALGPEALSHASGWQTDPGAAAGNLHSEIERDAAVAAFLLKHHPTDVFAAVCMAIDVAQHLFYAGHIGSQTDGDAPGRILRRLYQSMDRALGQLLDLADENTTVVVVSDHGAHPSRGTLNLDAVLADLGLLSFREGLPHWSELFPRRPPLRRRLLRPIWHPIRNGLRRLFPRPQWRPTRPSRLFSSVDWSRTKVFCWSRKPLLRVNLQGREPHGIVPPEEFADLCDEVVEQLRAYQHPHTGQPMFGLVAKATDLYAGPHAGSLVDIVAQVKDSAYATDLHIPHPDAPVVLDEQTYRSMDPNRRPLAGCHHGDGICILAGPGIPARAERAPAASIADLAPTLLYLLDQPIPREMDGTVMADLLGATTLAARPPRYCDTPLSVEAEPHSPAYRPEEQRRVEQRLRDLGYME
ncbi:MAG: alkaline phosphatase family protein [Armatimonadota bacterium]